MGVYSECVQVCVGVCGECGVCRWLWYGECVGNVGCVVVWVYTCMWVGVGMCGVWGWG